MHLAIAHNDTRRRPVGGDVALAGAHMPPAAVGGQHGHRARGSVGVGGAAACVSGTCGVDDAATGRIGKGGGVAQAWWPCGPGVGRGACVVGHMTLDNHKIVGGPSSRFCTENRASSAYPGSNSGAGGLGLPGIVSAPTLQRE